MPDFCVVLCSGGIDSATMLLELEGKYNEVIPIHFEYGQKNFIFERVCVSRLAKRLNLIPEFYDLRSIYKSWTTLVESSKLDRLRFEFPFRNQLFLTAACIVGQTKLLFMHGRRFRDHDASFDIAIAIHKHVTYEEYWDIKAPFIEKFNQLIDVSPFNIKVVAPFLELEKSEIMQRAEQVWEGGELFKFTATCYDPNYIRLPDGRFAVTPCEVCESCIERKNRVGDYVNKYTVDFSYKEAISYGISPRALQQVFLD